MGISVSFWDVKDEFSDHSSIYMTNFRLGTAKSDSSGSGWFFVELMAEVFNQLKTQYRYGDITQKSKR